MITAYQVVASYKGVDWPKSEMYFYNRPSADEAAFYSNTNGYDRMNVYRVEEVQIDRAFIQVELPYITSKGNTRIRMTNKIVRKLHKLDRVITGEVRDKGRTLIIERLPSDKVWHFVKVKE